MPGHGPLRGAQGHCGRPGSRADDLAVDRRPHAHNVGTCYRCGTTVEPMVSKQWFVKHGALGRARPSRPCAAGDIRFVPERFRQDLLSTGWRTSSDWCICRQLWWGHRIPAYYCDDCGEISVSANAAPHVCPKCGSATLHQDEDTLDTWFSSRPVAVLHAGMAGTRPRTFEYFYPTNTLVTGYDIIFFWVSRMIFSGLDVYGQSRPLIPC